MSEEISKRTDGISVLCGGMPREVVMRPRVTAFLNDDKLSFLKKYEQFIRPSTEKGEVERLDDEVLDREVFPGNFCSYAFLFDEKGNELLRIGYGMKNMRFLFWKWEEPYSFEELIYKGMLRCPDIERIHYCVWFGNTGCIRGLVVYKMPRVPSLKQWVEDHEARMAALVHSELSTL
jgi:hypothetical protein